MQYRARSGCLYLSLCVRRGGKGKDRLGSEILRDDNQKVGLGGEGRCADTAATSYGQHNKIH
jgi:hypothetical protein